MKAQATDITDRSIAGAKSRNGFLLLLFTVLTLFFYSCENDEKRIQDWTKKIVLQEEATNVESFLSQEGKLRARLTAPLMYRVSADTFYTEFPKSLHVDFYNDSTVVKESWLDCRYGKYFDNLNKVYLRDSVVVINIKGDTLKCQDLWWDQNTKLFYTDKYAEYRTLDKKIYPGKGLEATQDFSRVTFKEVTGQLKVKEGGFPE
ncbi:MAG: LPS export ABC transporter periplasmic protein LptC [Bacteroidetes bacterium]|nr:LPS export ABC transporter periplasmic protein LptC [Bacteroidota bacterium]